jgi:hypothetical protein
MQEFTMRSRRSLTVLALGLLVGGASAPLARAQYGYGYGAGGIYGRQGGALYGSSQVMNAYGNVVVQQEKARVEREVANQAKIDTKRKAFDEANYEKANTPAWVEEQEKVRGLTVRRIMDQPSGVEVITGKAQNTLLPYVQTLTTTGIQGPPILLDPALLAKINVMVPGQGGGIGLLRNGGRLRWPPLLRGVLQAKIDKMLPTAIAQTAQGELDPKLYRELAKQVATLQEQWRKQLHKEEIDAATYIDGNHYLESLDSSVKMLLRPGTAELLAGGRAAQGRDVQELVNNMTSQGLQFAPATPGNESAYYALQNSLVAYARGAQSGSGFQARLAPPQAAGASSYSR